MSNKVNILTIPPDKKVTLDISGLFYQRLNKLMIEYAGSVKNEELAKAFLAIKDNMTHSNHFAFNIETLMILMKAIEERFQEEGFAIDNEVDVEEIKKAVDEAKKD